MTASSPTQLASSNSAVADARPSRSYLRLDGAMSQAVRQKVVRKFTKTDKSVILLASLKAGGVGLNLVRRSHCTRHVRLTGCSPQIAADHVYLMDTWCPFTPHCTRRHGSLTSSPPAGNAAIENQAVDRIHRFGQTRQASWLLYARPARLSC